MTEEISFSNGWTIANNDDSFTVVYSVHLGVLCLVFDNVPEADTFVLSRRLPVFCTLTSLIHDQISIVGFLFVFFVLWKSLRYLLCRTIFFHTV